MGLHKGSSDKERYFIQDSQKLVKAKSDTTWKFEQTEKAFKITPKYMLKVTQTRQFSLSLKF